MSSNGFFITLEGIEGAGKSTHAEFLAQLLQARGRRVCLTREPGGTAAGEAIRAMLLGHAEMAIDGPTELLLIFAARAQHLAEVIRPALAAGAVVISDRFTDATFAYQGGGRGIPRDHIKVLEQLVQDGLRPDLTIFLDAPVETGLRRANARGDANRFEAESLAFFARVREAYLEIARAEPARVRILNAGRSLSEVQSDLQALVEERLPC